MTSMAEVLRRILSKVRFRWFEQILLNPLDPIRILATSSPALLEQMDQYRADLRAEVLKDSEI